MNPYIFNTVSSSHLFRATVNCWPSHIKHSWTPRLSPGPDLSLALSGFLSSQPTIKLRECGHNLWSCWLTPPRPAKKYFTMSDYIYSCQPQRSSQERSVEPAMPQNNLLWFGYILHITPCVVCCNVALTCAVVSSVSLLLTPAVKFKGNLNNFSLWCGWWYWFVIGVSTVTYSMVVWATG